MIPSKAQRKCLFVFGHKSKRCLVTTGPQKSGEPAMKIIYNDLMPTSDNPFKHQLRSVKLLFYFCNHILTMNMELKVSLMVLCINEHDNNVNTAEICKERKMVFAI